MNNNLPLFSGWQQAHPTDWWTPLILNGKIDQLKRAMRETGVTIDTLNEYKSILMTAAYSGLQIVNELLDMGVVPDFEFYYNIFLKNIQMNEYSHLNVVKKETLTYLKLILFLMSRPGIQLPLSNDAFNEYLNNLGEDIIPILSEINSVVPLNSERARPLIAFLGRAYGPDKLSELIGKSAWKRRRHLVKYYNTINNVETRKNMRNRWMRLANEQTRIGGRRRRRTRR